MPTPEECDEYLLEEAKKLKPGDRIQILRDRTRYPAGEPAPGEDWPEPDLWWEGGTITDVHPPAPAGNPIFDIEFDDARQYRGPLAGRWRRFAH